MHHEFLPYAKPSIEENDLVDVSKALKSATITRGPTVEAFEAAIAQYCGAQYAVAFSSGTAALAAAYHAVDTAPGDRLLTTPNTFIATAGMGIQKGATPIFIDIDRSTGNIDLSQLEFNINVPSSRGRTLVMPVHFSGIPVDMQLLDGLICNPETIVIEDAAHALGSTYQDGQRVGCCAWSQMTMFSFHPAKTITTGEGGMITTNDPELFRRLRLFRSNGIERDADYLQEEASPWYYEVQELTNNYNFTDFQAALGLSQLSRLELFIQKRRRLVQHYRERLAGLEHMRFFSSALDAHTAFHLFVIQVDFSALKTTRTRVMEALKARNIGSQVHYIPLYRHPFFKKQAGDISEYFPQAEEYYAQALSLPLFYDLTIDNVDYIVSSLKEILYAQK